MECVHYSTDHLHYSVTLCTPQRVEMRELFSWLLGSRLSLLSEIEIRFGSPNRLSGYLIDELIPRFVKNQHISDDDINGISPYAAFSACYRQRYREIIPEKLDRRSLRTL